MADLDRVDLETASSRINHHLGSYLNKNDIKWRIGGQDEERKKSAKSLMFAISLSIFLIYVILASQFESFRQPAIILFAVPLCVVGVALILKITSMSVSEFPGRHRPRKTGSKARLARRFGPRHLD